MVFGTAAVIATLSSSYRRLKISGLNRQLSERKFSAELEKFRVGETNIRDVIDFQTELTNSRVNEMNSRIEILIALAQLRSALGQLPEGVDYRFDG